MKQDKKMQENSTIDKSGSTFENAETICVDASEVGQRLDVFLSEVYSENTRSYIKKLIDSENVLVNDKAQKSGYKIKEGDKIFINFPEVEEIDAQPENIDIDIVYQDSDIVVVNKQKNMVVHPSTTSRTGTLVNALLYHIKDLSGINGKLRPGIVHRIDKDTTGLIVVAKNNVAHLSLSEQIKNKTCKRIYFAIVHGAPQNEQGVIKTQIGRCPKDRKKMCVLKEGEGREAITEYKLVEKFGKYSLMQFSLQTGRTHQIRVHCKHMNIQIVGDSVYGGLKNDFGATSQMLHAARLELVHPTTNEQMSFTAPLEKQMQRALDILKSKKH